MNTMDKDRQATTQAGLLILTCRIVVLTCANYSPVTVLCLTTNLHRRLNTILAHKLQINNVTLAKCNKIYYNVTYG